jgi:hypothetical protein
VDALKPVSRAAPSINAQSTLEHVVGRGHLDVLIVQRLRALGLAGVLDQARVSGTADATWVAALTAKIQVFVP